MSRSLPDEVMAFASGRAPLVAVTGVHSCDSFGNIIYKTVLTLGPVVEALDQMRCTAHPLAPTKGT